MKKLLIISVIFGAGYYFIFNASPTSFDEVGNPTAIVFTQNNCGTWCDNGIKDLERRNIPFIEFPIDNNKENKDRYESMSGKGLPFFVMGDKTLVGYGKFWFASTVAQVFGDKYLTYGEKRFYKHHFYDDGSPRIYVYGASWCPYCKKLRKEFAERDIDYFELDVEEAAESQLIVKTMGIDGFPVVYVGYIRVKNSSDLIGDVLNAIDMAGNRVF